MRRYSLGVSTFPEHQGTSYRYSISRALWRYSIFQWYTRLDIYSPYEAGTPVTYLISIFAKYLM